VTNWRQWIWGAPFLVLALVVLLTQLSPDRVWPAVALGLVGVLLIAVPRRTWGQVLARVESASVGPVGINLRQEVGKAAEQAPESDTEEGSSNEFKRAETMFDLRIRLEYKLAYVAKHLLAPSDGNATFVTVGSLKLDGYLTEAQARTAIGILGTRQEELEALPETAQAKFLSEASEFVDGMRASIFWGQVKRRLRGVESPDHESLFTKEIPGNGNRRDLLVKSTQGPVRVAPAFALDKNSKILQSTVDRLRGEGLAARGGERQIVVVPDRSRARTRPKLDDQPAVVKLGSLRGMLEAS
jgi:hypothetical protein